MDTERAFIAVKNLIETIYECGLEDCREPACVAADIVDRAHITLEELTELGFQEIVEAYRDGQKADEEKTKQENREPGFQLVYPLVKKARMADPVDTQALLEIREKYGNHYYTEALNAVLKEMGEQSTWKCPMCGFIDYKKSHCRICGYDKMDLI